MGFEAIKSAIESRFNTAWASETPVAYGNVPFSPPAAVAVEYVRLNVLFGKEELMGMPGPHRASGMVDVQVFVPEGTGTNRLYELADLAAAVFRSQIFSGITCRSPELSPLMVEDGLAQINVSVPFRQDNMY